MGFKTVLNPYTGELQLVTAPSSGSTGVMGVAPSTDKAITRWQGTAADTIQDSKTQLQDGGAIEAQGFLTRRSITDLVTIPSGESWIAPSLELELTGSIYLEPDAELIIV